MSNPSSYGWGTNSNEPSSSQRPTLNNWQEFGSNVQGSWQQQNVPVAQQHHYSQQQGNWNNNLSQKSLPSHMNYKEDRNYSWNHPSREQPQQHLSQQQQSQLYQFSNNPNQFFEGVSNAPPPPVFSARHQHQQMSYNTTAASDPWNWGWEEPINPSPAPSFPANNNVSNDGTGGWNLDDNVELQPFNPVHNYFQQTKDVVSQPTKFEQFTHEVDIEPNSVPVAQNYFENEGKPNVEADKKVKLDDGGGDASVSEALNFHSSDVDTSFDVKSDSAQSFQSSNLSVVSDTKQDRLSPGENQIPLTTQALRDFCKVKYENGPLDTRSRSNADGLTPQWSVESQMSQETASDEISPSVQEGSHSDLSMWDVDHPHVNEHSREINSSSLNARHGVQTKEQMQNRDLENAFVSNLDPERVNQQVIQGGGPPPPPSAPKSGDLTGNNPYSLGQNLKGKKVLHSRTVENEYNNLVKQMDKFIVSDDNQNQQVITENTQAVRQKTPNQGTFQSENWYCKRVGMEDELLNQETIPDNEERPEEEHGAAAKDSSTGFQTFNSQKNLKTQSSRNIQSYASGSDNQEVAPRSDRNQYLETGRLEGQMESDVIINNSDLVESLPPPGLSRHVPGETQGNPGLSTEETAVGISSPPPGLDRMVLGQITENESVPVSDVNSFRRNQITPPPGLHRMVPGQLTDDQSQFSAEEATGILSPGSRRDDIPPPGFRRMIPGESSSPETQGAIQMPEQRVVTGVAKDEIDVGQTSIPSSSPTPANRLASQTANPEEARLQFQSERCETIGSDNVDNYSPNPVDISSAKLGKRKEGKDRDRRREDISSDETEREPPRRHDRDSDYYSKRDRNREREDSSGERFRDDRDRRKGRERVDWDRERRKESPGRYREERSRRRDYREDRRRHKDYDYSDDDDDDADTNGYYSDRERRNMSRYRDDYDRGYSRRDDRARSLRPEKSLKDPNDESHSSENSSVRASLSIQDFSDQTDVLPAKSCKSDDWAYSLPLSLPIRSSGKSRRHGGYDRERDLDRDLNKERDRDRDRERGKDRDRQSDYYRRRDELEEYSQRSRPSSRNDSIQDYKHRSARSDYDGDKEKDHYRSRSKRDRDIFYPPGYNYDPAYYNYYYQYYENLRRTNPAAYAEWFRKYYASSQHGTFDGTYTEDRGSVHSGRSSVNEESKDRYLKPELGLIYGSPYYQMLVTDQNYPYQSQSSDICKQTTRRRLDSSLQMEPIQRLTPAKFTTAHVKGILTARGQLLKILAHYPLDGQPATLEIHDSLPCFADLRKEFSDFPGPLVKGVTHKNNILRFCKQKIKEADLNPDIFDKESYKLIWELLILLIRQNGTVVGTDIAELLMSNRSSRVSRSQTPASHAAADGASQSTISEEEVTNQFRDYLIYGNTKEALEWAMKHGLWGHALFLASKTDQRTYASVMTRFANGLTMNDPLQTLYQLMSGKQPASVTCCADEKWGDWRPHLAMILSNSTARPDLDLKAVTTLGDTLGSRGNLHAAHFCYLMAQIEFGTYAQKSSKIVLIGSSHVQPFQQFANNEAIFATEIFEFACSLADPDFVLHHLQNYKLLMAKRLSEVGLVQEAVHYVEVIANTIAKFPAQYAPFFIQEVYNLGNMLKCFDPVYNSSEGNVSDPEWLLRLFNILNDYQTGVLQHDGFGSVSNLTTYSENEGVQNLPLDVNVQDPANDTQSWQNQQQLYYEQPIQQQQQQQQQWHQNDQSNYSLNSGNTKSFLSVEQPSSAPPSADTSNSLYWSNQNQWMQPPGAPNSSSLNQSNENEYISGMGVAATDNNQNHSAYNYYDSNRNENSSKAKSPAQASQLRLPGSKPRTVSQSSEDRKSTQGKGSKPSKKELGKHSQATGSWFGGIWNKLPFRPKNQMILPDDKNPSIVWDSDKNRWVNLNADEDDSGGTIPPPPKASELVSTPIPKPNTSMNAPVPLSSYNPNLGLGNETSDQPDASSTPTLPPSGPNKYKMTRGKSLRSNYVDVLNPGATKAPSPAIPAPELFPPINYSSQMPNFSFVPAPVEGNENAPTDFLSPSNPPVIGRVEESNESFQPQQALSRWSSTSSLSREVQKYTMKRVGSRTQGSPSVHEDHYKDNGRLARYPPNHTSLGRSKGFPK